MTQRGEKTIEAIDIKMIAKSILPLPEKWHGLKDEEDRYRKRYLDILFNPEVKDMIVKKSVFWNSMREFLCKEGFLEVETPVLENTAGGADAEPFKTFHNALGIEVYLRISMGELWQKKLMVAGFEKLLKSEDSSEMKEWTQSICKTTLKWNFIGLTPIINRGWIWWKDSIKKWLLKRLVKPSSR